MTNQPSDEFCNGGADCDCGCGEFDGVDLDAESEAMNRLGIVEKDKLYFFYPEKQVAPRWHHALGYGPGGYFNSASGQWVNAPGAAPNQVNVSDLYVKHGGQNVLVKASDFPKDHIVQSLAGTWFKSDGTMWCRTDDRPSEKVAYSGPIAGDEAAIAARLKDIEPKYVTPKPPAEALDVWAKGTARRNDGWLWRWSGTEWKKEGPAF